MILFVFVVELNASQSEEMTRRTCSNGLNQRLTRVCEPYGGINGLQTVNRRIKRGIVEECCHSRCPDSFIRRFYCKNSK